MRFDYLVLVPTYNRPDGLDALIRHLIAEQKRMKFKVLYGIVDDHSDRWKEYLRIIDEWKRLGVNVKAYRNHRNFGRQEFWRTITALLKIGEQTQFRYGYFLADDLVLCREFFRRTTTNFQFLQEQDEHCHAMNLTQIHPKNWGTIRWVDGSLICTRKFMRRLNFAIEPIDKARFGEDGKKNISSGVWKQVTERIASSGVRIAPVTGVSYTVGRAGCNPDAVKKTPDRSEMFPNAEFGERPRQRWHRTFVEYYMPEFRPPELNRGQLVGHSPLCEITAA